MDTTTRPANLACELGAISAACRPRYSELVRKLRLAVRSHQELADGYALTLSEEAITLPELAEWIGMERLCCPFLTFHLELRSGVCEMQLSLRGPEGVKVILETASIAGI